MLRENPATCDIRHRPLERRIHRRWLALALLGILVTGTTASLATNEIDLVPPPSPSAFSIDKAEGSQVDDVYVIYLRKDRYLTDVTASVTIHYVMRARPVVTQSWPQWTGGEKKTFHNTEFRYGPIRKVELIGTATEHFFTDDRETARKVRFAESKSF
jgi:hypothetical protein